MFRKRQTMFRSLRTTTTYAILGIIAHRLRISQPIPFDTVKLEANEDGREKVIREKKKIAS